MLQLIITAVDVILMARGMETYFNFTAAISYRSVYALYGKNRRLLMIMCSLLLVEISILSWILAKVTPQLTFTNECFVTSSPSLFIAYWYVNIRLTVSANNSNKA